MSDSYEELAKLLWEYDGLLDQPEYRYLRVASDPDNERTCALKNKLPEIPDRCGAIDIAIEWWRDYGEPLTKHMRMERLHHLLRRLDQAFEGYHPRLQVKTKAGLLLLGEGWWLAYRSAKTAETGNEISRADWIRDTPLPRIRVVPDLGALWLNSGPLRERIWNMVGAARREGRLPQVSELRIGLCVLGRHAKTQFEATGVLDQTNNIHGFRAVAVVWDAVNQGSVEAELHTCVAWARQSRIHVLCFPELTLDGDGRDALRREIERDPGALCLVFPGSFHERDRNPRGGIEWVNRAPIWAVHSGAKPGVLELGGH